MKIVGRIFEFLVNPFAILLNIDVKNKDNDKHKVLNIILWLLLSIAVTALFVYAMHKLMR